MTIKDQPVTTIREFEKILSNPHHQNRLLELVHGVVYEKMPTEEHGWIAGWIITFINMYLMQNKIGIAAVEARHQIGDDELNSRLPDVSFIKGERPTVKTGSVPQMPDLAVEVKSPTDTYIGLREKASYYLENGCQLVWLIFPEKELVEVYRPGEDVEILKIDDTLDGGDVLPGFRLPIKSILHG